MILLAALNANTQISSRDKALLKLADEMKLQAWSEAV